MFLARRPSIDAIERFLRESDGLPLSYGDPGLLRRVPSHLIVEVSAVIGHGAEDFGKARAALRSWRQFELGWVELLPRAAATVPGTVVAVLIQHLGFWSLNGCRVVEAEDSEHGFGYVYGTLTNHAESGEELFQISLDPVSNEVVYRIRATARPQAMLARIGQPIVRMLQERFRRGSIAAMGGTPIHSATSSSGPPSTRVRRESRQLPGRQR